MNRSIIIDIKGKSCLLKAFRVVALIIIIAVSNMLDNECFRRLVAEDDLSAGRISSMFVFKLKKMMYALMHV